ncbi:MAG: hypothetical protein EXR93_04650 [Gemmatimonadetes bacterium]|nr:hypothetical protein [Gemmatimonadota bacterium]
MVITHDVFDSSEVAGNPGLGLANALHFRTRAEVVRREILFRAGNPLDSARVAETLRNLRRLGLFRNALADTLRLNDRLVTRVQTYDAWTTSLELNGRSTGGTFTWSTGITELNFLGTGDIASLRYRKDVDRSSFTGQGIMRRMFGTRVRGQIAYSDLSDGHQTVLGLGSPWRAFSDRNVLDGGAEWERRLVYQYRGGFRAQTYQSRAFRGAAIAATALHAEPSGFLRVGFWGMFRNEEFVRLADTLLVVPDTISGAVAAYMDWRKARFAVVTHVNGFAQQEDIDLSTGIKFGAWVAPSAFGYARTGIGPFYTISTGVPLGGGFVRFFSEGHGLFSSAGLDSGQVSASATLAVRSLPRQSTVLFLYAGAQRSPEPGSEFDLGHGVGPRAFGAHAFTGTRTVWGTFEQRAWLVDELFNLMGLGLAAFLDYGGAWYPGDPVRRGGDIGMGLRLGATRATGANLGRFDLGYRFGDGIAAGRSRWVFSFGRAFSY